MALGRPTGAASRAVALALAVALGGGLQVIGSATALEAEHRCQCPAHAHACSCPRCTAKARAAPPPSHGGATAAKAPCHGTASASAEPAAPERQRPLPDAPCLSPSCHGRGAVATLLGDEDPFVVPGPAAASTPGRTEDLAGPVLASVSAPAVPEPPPPRA